MPGFAAFDAGGAKVPDAGTEPVTSDASADTPDASGEAKAGPAPEDRPRTPSVVESIESPTVAAQAPAARAAAASNRNGASAAAGGPRVVVQPAGPVNGAEAGDEAHAIPEFLRRAH